MADEFVVVPFNADTVSATQDFTSGTITDPSVAIFIMSGATSTGSTVADARLSFGWATLGATPVAQGLAARVEDATSTLNSYSEAGSGSTLLHFSSDAVFDCVASVNSVLSNGVRMDWTTQPSEAFEGVAILIGGSTTDPETDIWASSAMPDTIGISLTNPKWSMSLASNTSLGVGDQDAQVVAGFAAENPSDAVTQTFASLFIDDSSSPSAGSIRTPTNGFSCGFEPTDSTEEGMELDAFNAGDIDLIARNYTIAGGSLTRGTCVSSDFSDAATQVTVKTQVIDSTTGAVSFDCDGIQPKLVIGIVSLSPDTSSRDTTSLATTIGMFAFDATTEWSTSMRVRHGVTNPGPHEAESRAEDKAIHLMDHLGTVVVDGTRTITGQGFSINFTASTDGLVQYIVFGEEGTGDQAQDDTENISESAELTATRYEEDDDTVEISESVGEVLVERTFAQPPFDSDTGLSGVQQDDLAAGGAQATDDGASIL